MALTKVTGSVIKDSVSLSGNVSVGGTLTYQDVTNVDALGIGTFRTGIKVLAGQVDVGSNIKLGNAGVITATSFSGAVSGTTGSFSGSVTVGQDLSIPDKIVHSGDSNTAIRFPTNDIITAETGGSERLRIDSAGNMGLGITPDTQGNTVDSLQIGSATNLYNETSDDYTILGNNVYFDGTNNKYIKTQQSSRLMQNAGEFTFQQAASGSADANITYTTPLKITSGGDISISGDGTVHGVSKLTVLPANRTTAFSASDGDTWHDIVLKQTGSATNNAVGIAFETSTSAYHKNAGTGIAAVKNGTNSDYGADLVFITRPQSAVAEERLRITSSGQLIVNSNSATDAQFTVVGSGHYVVTSAGRAHKHIHCRAVNGNSGEFGGAISFGMGSNGSSAIAAEQMGSDGNVNGLAFFTHPTSSGSDDSVKRMKINNTGGITLNNWESNRGFIFERLDSGGASYPDFANVQGSNGRGMISSQKTINQNTTTDLCKSHWGGLALVGYSGSGHQGVRQVMFGYGGAGASVRFSGNWVGGLTTTFTVSAYTLRVSHNASNALDFWVILIGI